MKGKECRETITAHELLLLLLITLKPCIALDLPLLLLFRRPFRARGTDGSHPVLGRASHLGLGRQRKQKPQQHKNHGDEPRRCFLHESPDPPFDIRTDPARIAGTPAMRLAGAGACTALNPCSSRLRASRKRAPELLDPSTTATMRVLFFLAVTTR